MMHDQDQDLKDLRPHARMLRAEVDVAPLVAGVMKRARVAPTVTGWLALWFRPAIAAVVILAVITGAILYSENSQPPDLVSTEESRILTEVANADR